MLQAFALHESKLRRVGKMLLGGVVSVAVSAAFGREWFFVMLGATGVAVLVIHGWLLPRRGVNGLTAEPREKYFALRGWTAKPSRRVP